MGCARRSSSSTKFSPRWEKRASASGVADAGEGGGHARAAGGRAQADRPERDLRLIGGGRPELGGARIAGRADEGRRTGQLEVQPRPGGGVEGRLEPIGQRAEAGRAGGGE